MPAAGTPSELPDRHDWDLPPPAVQVLDTPVGGRLAHFCQNWEILGDPYVTNIIQHRYKLTLIDDLPLTSSPIVDTYPPTQQQPLSRNITALLYKKAIEVVHAPAITLGFYSPVFLVPKKDSGQGQDDTEPHRLQQTLPGASTVIPDDHAQATAIPDPGAGDAHQPGHQGHLIFMGVHYQWVVPPFGISSAPWLFTRLTKPIASYLHRRDIQFKAYIDDCLLDHLDTVTLLRHRDFTLRLLYQSGINFWKRLQFIRGLFQTDLDLISVPRDRWECMQAHLIRALHLPRTLRQWQVLLGLLTSAQDLTYRGRLQLRPVQMFLAPYIRRQDPALSIVLPDHLKQHLFVDLSLQGWGAHLEGQVASGLWSTDQRLWHINNLELEAHGTSPNHQEPL
ncbi:uncharacterized protein [Haliotis cracherodii]|uniref:uncharacterized protein n=1 Tax=Haliotis cracherodii TaxID=6455 RepID=UPI0039EB90DC